jgi:hypothetical protein
MTRAVSAAITPGIRLPASAAACASSKPARPRYGEPV